MSNDYVQGRYTPVNPEKYVGSNIPQFRSSWEWTVMKMLDTNPNIVAWASESIKIPYINPFTGKHTVYVPDFLVRYVNASGITKTEIIEVKPAKETFLEQAKSQRNKAAVALNTYKWAAANAYAKAHGMSFRVLTESNIYNNPKRKT